MTTTCKCGHDNSMHSGICLIPLCACRGFSKPAHTGTLITDLERMVDAGMGMAFVGPDEPDDERDRR